MPGETELLELLNQLYVHPDMPAYLAMQLKQAQADQATPFPQVKASEGMPAVANLGGGIDAGIMRFIGQQKQAEIEKQLLGMMGNERDAQKAFAGAALGGMPPRNLQILAGAGGRGLASTMATISRDQAIAQEKASRDEAERQNRQRLLDKTNEFKLKALGIEEEGKNFRYNPATGRWNADTGGFIFDPRTREIQKLPGDPAYAEAKNERAAAAKPKNLPDKELSKLQDQDATVGNIGGLLDSFKDDYTLQITVPGAKFANVIEGGLGGLAGEESEERVSWWKDWSNLFELLKTHELFGSAFTQHEKQAWALAQKVVKGASPKVIREGLTAIRDAAARWVARRSEARIGGGYQQAEIYPVTPNTRAITGGGTTPAPAPGKKVPKYNPNTGEFE